jgi:hypothetical protein
MLLASFSKGHVAPIGAVGTLIAILKTKPRLGTAGVVFVCPGGALTMEQRYDEVSARARKYGRAAGSDACNE